MLAIAGVMTASVIGAAGCASPCEETLIDDPSEFEDFEAAAAAETFCGGPTLSLVLGAAAAQGDWIDADAVQDGDEAWFPLGPAGGWMESLAIETTSLSSIIEVQVVATFDIGGDGAPVFAENRHIQAIRTDEGASTQRFWGLRVMLPCELWPEGLPSAPCEPLGVPYEDVRLDLTVTVNDHADRAVTASHTGPIRVQDYPP